VLVCICDNHRLPDCLFFQVEEWLTSCKDIIRIFFVDIFRKLDQLGASLLDSLHFCIISENSSDQTSQVAQGDKGNLLNLQQQW